MAKKQFPPNEMRKVDAVAAAHLEILSVMEKYPQLSRPDWEEIARSSLLLSPPIRSMKTPAKD